MKRKERFDIIVGDLADPLEDGPCYQLYTKSFYEKILKPKLNDNGIFVTQVVISDNPFKSWWENLSFHILNKVWQKRVCILCRLDQQVYSHTKRSSLLYITQSNRSSNVRLSTSSPLLCDSSITDIINRVKIAHDVLLELKLKLQRFFGADVIAYTTHVPSFADTWGWVMVCKKRTLFLLLLMVNYSTSKVSIM